MKLPVAYDRSAYEAILFPKIRMNLSVHFSAAKINLAKKFFNLAKTIFPSSIHQQLLETCFNALLLYSYTQLNHRPSIFRFQWRFMKIIRSFHKSTASTNLHTWVDLSSSGQCLDCWRGAQCHLHSRDPQGVRWVSIGSLSFYHPKTISKLRPVRIGRWLRTMGILVSLLTPLWRDLLASRCVTHTVRIHCTTPRWYLWFSLVNHGFSEFHKSRLFLSDSFLQNLHHSGEDDLAEHFAGDTKKVSPPSVFTVG